MLLVKKKSEGSDDGSVSPSSRSPSAVAAAAAAAAPHHRDPVAVVGDLVSSLNTRKRYREVTLALQSGIRDAAAEFSFLRTGGLRGLLKALRFIAQNDAAVPLFQSSQSIPELQVVPALFQNTLRQPKVYSIANLDHIIGMEPMKICSPATNSEIALGLRVLEGCCLLHQGSKNLAHQHNAIKVLLNFLSTRGVLEQSACLDALVSLMLDFPANQLLFLFDRKVHHDPDLILPGVVEVSLQIGRLSLLMELNIKTSVPTFSHQNTIKEFEACHGIEKIAELIKDEQGDESIRLKCGEFLLLLIGHVNGRERPPLATIHDDVRQLLGEKCASLVWAASQFGSTLDPEQRQTALHIQAGRVLEALEFH